MKTTTLLTAITAFVAGTATAGTLNIPDYTLTPDGTNFGSDGGNTSTELQTVDVKALNGNSNVLPSGSLNTVYVITTFNWGENSNAHHFLNFAVQTGAGGSLQPNRLGLSIDDDGNFRTTGDGNDNTVDFDLNQDMAGESVTVLWKLEYDPNHSVEFSQSNASNDTTGEFWVNPTNSALENASDFQSSVWNSANFPIIEQRIDNQSTPGTAGDSSISNTVILTGSDATFANALALAVPEPGSLALLGLGGLLIARRRRA